LYKIYPNKTLAVCGDFNVDILKTNSEANVFLNTLRSLNLYCVNNSPTRFKACLDNIAVNTAKKCITSVKLLPQNILSDHAGLWVTLELTSPRPVTRDSSNKDKPVRRIINQNSINNFINNLGLLDWTNLYKLTDIELAFSQFITIFSNCLNNNCLIKPVKTKKASSKKWFTKELKDMRTLMLALYDKYKITKRNEDLISFKRFKKQYTLSIRKAKIEANSKFIQNSNNKCRAAWSVIKSETGQVNSKKVETEISADEFNDFFINMPLSVNNNNNDFHISNNCFNNSDNLIDHFLSNQKKPIVNFRWVKIDPLTIKNNVKNLSSSKSEDIYGISNMIV